MIHRNIVSILVTILSIVLSGVAYCDNIPSYDDVANNIEEIMINNPSEARKERYGYVHINNCRMDYNVLGTYPVGELYNIKYSNMDFSNINYKLSRTGHDYTSFLILKFNNDIKYNDGIKELAVRTVVINIASDEKARELFKAFQQLGELCGAKDSPQ